MCILRLANFLRRSTFQISCIFLLVYMLPILMTNFVSASMDEKRLYTDLLTNYNILERPVSNSSTPLVIKMRLFLQQIVDVDEKNQIWEDYKLKWDPQEYDGIKDLHFPGDNSRIWRPDILLYNSADDNFDSTFKSNLLVYSNGEVNWIPPGILKFSCKLDITWFPFDEQICGLKFGSWTHNGFALDLQIDADDSNSTHQMDISDYVLNGEWDLIATPAVRNVKRFVCCPEPYPTITFYMHIRRRTLYYGFNLLIPSLLISLMTMLGFALPPDAGEKITLEITILLSIVFFLSMVAEMTPATSEAVPLIGVFFSCCMLVVSASVVFTVVVLNLHFRTPESHVMTPLIRRILLEWLPWLLMMSRPGTVYSRGEALMKSETSSRTKEDDYNPLVEDILSGRSASDTQILLLHQLYLKLKQISDQMTEDEESERLRNDWKFSAMVVDRACLICFSLFITLSTCSIILSAPHLTI
uniref:Acetylcholine receptor subunit alpha-type acr-16 n=1 Tax=Elaeophora elaphi TaxID=1147741 RepID=A0A0R3RWT7_9BILA